MESSRWIAAVASIWVQCSGGASYAFGIYSPLLKSSQNYDQSTLDLISVFKDIGANAGILSGLLYTATATNRRRQSNSCFHGPWVVLAAGAMQCFVGYFFIWLAVIGAIPRPEVPVMCLLIFLGAHAQTFFSTANVVTAVQNFPEYSGTIVGIMKGYLGLSGAVLIQVYQTLFRGKPSTFVLMLALLPTTLSILLMWFVRVHHIPNRDEDEDEDEKKYLNGFSSISLTVAAYLMFLIILKNTICFSPWAYALSLVVLLVLLSSPILIAIKAHKENFLRSSQTLSSLNTPLMKDPDLCISEKSIIKNHSPEGSTNEDHKPESEVTFHVEELNLIQAMKTMNFWLLFIAMLCGMGSGLATINNISQIGESLGYTSVERSTLVSLWSIWNFLGRFGAGYVSDNLMHSRGWARPLFMTLTLAAMAGGHIIIGSGFPGNLYVGSILVGVCYGSQWSLMPTISSEIFGVAHLGTIFNTIAVASPVGSYLLSVRVIGYIYDREAVGEGNSCSGAHCFMISFFILASVSLFGFLVAFILFMKTKGLYRIIILRHLRNSGTVED